MDECLVFHGGWSLQLLNVDTASQQSGPSAVLHAIDVRITVNATNLVAFCTTRRIDVVKIKFVQVTDVRRSGDHRGGAASAAVGGHSPPPPPPSAPYSAAAGFFFSPTATEIDFTTLPTDSIGSRVGSVPRTMRLVLMHTAGGELTERLFKAVVARWSMARVFSNSYDASYQEQQQLPPTSSFNSQRVNVVSSHNQLVGGGGVPLHTGTYPHQTQFAKTSDQRSAYSSMMVGDHQRYPPNYCVNPTPFVGEFQQQQQQQQEQAGARWRRTPPYLPADNNNSNYNYHNYNDGRSGDGMDQWAKAALARRCCETKVRDIEGELQLIQQRRRQRQSLLMSAGGGGGGGGGFSLGIGDDGASFFGLDPLPPEAVDPVASVTSLCPHCGKYGSELHKASCQLMAVRCSRCGQLMKRKDLTDHLSLCSAMPNSASALAAQIQQQQLQLDASAYANVPVPLVPPLPKPPERKEEDEKVVEEGNDEQRRCVWCKKRAPKSHDAKCVEKRVLCSVCHKEVMLRDKAAHKAKCFPRDNVAKQKKLQQQKDQEEAVNNSQREKEKEKAKKGDNNNNNNSPAEVFRSSGGSRVRFSQ